MGQLAPGGGFFMPRSAYSLLRATSLPEDLFRYARALGYSSMAISDLGNLYALPASIRAGQGSGVKLIAAAEISWAGKSLFSAVALDQGGFSRLCAILSRRFAALAPGSLERPDPSQGLDWIKAEGCQGLAFISRDMDTLLALKGMGASRLYLGLDAWKPWAKAWWSLRDKARQCGISPIAIHAPYAFRASDPERLALLRCVALRLGLQDYRAALCPQADGMGPRLEAAGRPGLAPQLPETEDIQACPTGLPEPLCQKADFCVPAVELASLFSALPEALATAAELAEMAQPAGAFLSDSPIFPPYQPPSGDEVLSGDQANALLAAQCRKAIPERYGAGALARPDIEQRLARELDIIARKGFSPYFLTVRDIVLSCPRTCGRGSAASSIVSYLLKITHVDPLEHDLYFERFLNEGRADPPDIDVDFPWDERPALLDSVFTRFRGRVAMVADHCFFRRGGALREAALALGSAEVDIADWASLHRQGRWSEIPAFVREAAESIRGLPRYIGCHPGGVVIVPGRITDHCHVQESLAGYPLLGWEKEGAEAAGLVKIDLLGNRSLAVLRDCIELCRPKLGGDPKIEWGDFSVVRDPLTRHLIEGGRTLGVFYVESPATRSLLKRMGRGDYEHLVVASSIIRPAANAWIGEYVLRLHTGEWERLPDSAEATLRETHGIMVYQEDVSRIAEAVAGFNAADADALRKALTKKRRGPRLSSLRDAFFLGARRRGCPEAAVEILWRMMLSFDGYSFCKAHSASYALVSYKLAYLRARRPLEFFCAVINNGGGFYRRQIYINELRRLGFSLLPPDVQQSQWAYTIEEPAGRPAALRLGLSQVKGLSRASYQRLASSRAAAGPFRDLSDFVRRSRAAADELRSLILSGAMDSLGQSRPSLIWQLAGLNGAGRRRGGPDPCPGELALFAAEGPDRGHYSAMEEVLDESRTLSLFASRHPVSLFCERGQRMAQSMGLPNPVAAESMDQLVGARISLVACLAASKEVRCSTGQSMAFLSLEDSSSIFEAILFPQAYSRLLPILEGSAAYLVVGEVKNETGNLSLEVEDLYGLSRR